MKNKASLAENGIIYNVQDTQKITDSTTAIKSIITVYKVRAGLNPEAILNVNNNNAYQTYLAGSDYINEQCDTYLEAIDSYSKYYTRAKGMTTNTATLAELVLAASGAGNIALGITAASFGFTSSSLELFESSVLLELEPSGIRRLVERQISSHEKKVGEKPPATQSELIKNLRAHIKLCLPTSIKAAVNDSIKAAVIITDEDGVTLIADINKVKEAAEDAADKARDAASEAKETAESIKEGAAN
jgi:hypothetical protein